MGRVLDVLAQRDVANHPSCSATRLVAEDNRDGTYHVHLRNLRIDLDRNEFLELAGHLDRARRALLEASGSDEDDGRPGAGYVVLDRVEIPPSPRHDAGVLRVELNDPELIHVHLRNLRLDLVPDELRTLAEVLANAWNRYAALERATPDPTLLRAELEGLFTDLDDATVRTTLLWSWRTLPDSLTGGDIDIAVHPADLHAFIDVLRRRGWHGGEHPAWAPHGGEDHVHLDAWVRLGGARVRLDAVTHACARGRVLPASLQDALWERSHPHARGFRVPELELEATLLLVRALHHKGLQPAYLQVLADPSLDEARLVGLLGTCFAAPEALARAVLDHSWDTLPAHGALLE